MSLLLLFSGGGTVTATLRTADGELLANTTVRYALLGYASGSVANAGWMTLLATGTTTTSAGGVCSIPTDEGTGTTVYLAVLEPSVTPMESFITSVVVA